MKNKVANCLFISNRPPLQRGSSFVFLTPGTPWDFSLVSHNDKINTVILHCHAYVFEAFSTFTFKNVPLRLSSLSLLHQVLLKIHGVSQIFALLCHFRRESAKIRTMIRSVSPALTSRWVLLAVEDWCSTLEHVLTINCNPSAWLRLSFQKACALYELSIIPHTLRLHKFLSGEIIWAIRNMIKMSVLGTSWCKYANWYLLQLLPSHQNKHFVFILYFNSINHSW